MPEDGARALNPGAGWWEGAPSADWAELLRARAALRPEALALAIQDARGRTQRWDYATWARHAAQAAGALVEVGVRRGDRVALVLPTGPDFIAALFGTLWLGAAAVPLYPPARLEGLEGDVARLARQLRAAQPRAVVTLPAFASLAGAAAHRADSLAWVGALPWEGASAWSPGPPVGPELPAVVQFSSGSTGHPKGVVLTHGHIMANALAILSQVWPGPEDAMASWLPLYHDMGLVGALLAPLMAGIPIHLMPPERFLLDPKAWLHLISQSGATISTAPNFAYQLCATRLDDRELAGLSLGHWRIAMCGAEPVQASSMAAFAERMAPHGFRAEALTPVYGLAEVVLGASFSPMGQGVVVHHLDRLALECEGQALPLPPSDPKAIALVSVGQPLPGMELRAVDAQGLVLPEGQVGELQVRGPSVCSGYLNDPDTTASTLLPDGWCRTGDLGLGWAGAWIVVGRRKDLIVKAGRKLVPQDVEAAASVPGVRRGRVVALGVMDSALGTEALVVLAESRLPHGAQDALVRAISGAVAAELGLRPDEVRVLPPGALPRTSSGKLRRAETLRRWQSGALEAPRAPSWARQLQYLGQASWQAWRHRKAKGRGPH